MSNRRVIEEYFNDINGLAELLAKLTNSYRLMIGGAGELNSIALATKGDVKSALRRVNRLGEAIDDIIYAINEIDKDYIEYCRLKKEILKCGIKPQFIQNEIEEEIKK